ncbi:MAG TPA: PAS domain S-box protein [Verrucomicrobiae bacterium]|nr:PAS domain S-box protein [Verrucomicrobiae bacterium]
MLHLEDNPADAELILDALESEGLECRITRAQTRGEFEAALENETFDVILSDFALPAYDGITALRHAREKYPATPFILISGTLGEEQAVESLKSGATDYILKTRLLRLPTAVRRALHEAQAETRRRRAEETLRQSQELFRQITENVDDLIVVLDLMGKRIYISPSYRRLFDNPPARIGTDSFADVHPDDQERIQQIFRETVITGTGQRTEYRFITKDGSTRFIESQGSVIRNREGKTTNVLVVSRDITDRKAADAELAKTHKELLTASRQAGMAEVATGVLHNVGNVLNSVNISATCIADGLSKSKVYTLPKIVALLHEHEQDLGGFFTNDPKGKQLPGFLARLSDHIVAEREIMQRELAELQNHINHIKEIVAMQQNYAKISGLTETVNVVDLVEDSLRMHGGEWHRKNIQLVREFQATPSINVEKHKVLQILVNLLRNAECACGVSDATEKRIIVGITNGEGRIKISVTDNGDGIRPENMTRIFSHGFTTRKTGHGFGLHSGALAAKEMGGALLVHSDGPGRGARFTLELPAK